MLSSGSERMLQCYSSPSSRTMGPLLHQNVYMAHSLSVAPCVKFMSGEDNNSDPWPSFAGYESQPSPSGPCSRSCGPSPATPWPGRTVSSISKNRLQTSPQRNKRRVPPCHSIVRLRSACTSSTRGRRRRDRQDRSCHRPSAVRDCGQLRASARPRGTRARPSRTRRRRAGTLTKPLRPSPSGAVLRACGTATTDPFLKGRTSMCLSSKVRAKSTPARSITTSVGFVMVMFSFTCARRHHASPVVGSCCGDGGDVAGAEPSPAPSSIGHSKKAGRRPHRQGRGTRPSVDRRTDRLPLPGLCVLPSCACGAWVRRHKRCYSKRLCKASGERKLSSRGSWPAGFGPTGAPCPVKLGNKAISVAPWRRDGQEMRFSWKRCAAPPSVLAIDAIPVAKLKRPVLHNGPIFLPNASRAGPSRDRLCDPTICRRLLRHYTEPCNPYADWLRRAGIGARR